LNPLYIQDTAPFSDAFLLLACSVVVALAASFWLQAKPQTGEFSQQSPSEPRPAQE
jgi:hypothetical protein